MSEVVHVGTIKGYNRVSNMRIVALLRRVFDEEDRQLLAQIVAVTMTGGSLILIAALVFGLAVRVFGMAAG